LSDPDPFDHLLEDPPSGDEPGEPEPGEGDNGLMGRRIALVGKLGGMNRREAANLLRSYAAVVTDIDAAELDWVVIGAEESPLSETALLTPEIRARAAAGKLEIIPETELWQRAGLLEIERSIRRYYTPAMLADLLGVSVRVIRRWHRRGLIVPARTLHKLPYFDFQEVATARRLAELVAAGASPRAIEDRLRELAEVLPEVSRPLAQLSVLIEGQQVLLRQGEGLIEPGGQLRFDFSATDNPADETEGTSPETLRMPDPFSDPPQGGMSLRESGPASQRDPKSTSQRDPKSTSQRDPKSTSLREGVSYPFRDGSTPAARDAAWDPDSDELLQAVYEAEDAGDLATAIDCCRAILARDGSRADICFQLGELLYRDGQIEAARERYYCAIEIDDAFVEARTSLACVLAETGRPDLAIAALRGVLTLVPDYPDAHYHLATLLEEQGDADAAAQHWSALRRIAPDHLWSQPLSE
jgi:tetratricopeptide (TPR) repeat protein